MGRLVMALTAACVALVAAAARAETVRTEQIVLAPSVLASHGVPSGSITTFAVTCRRGYVAVSAGVASPAPGASVLAVTPVGVSAYRFRIDNPSTNGDQRITVSAACRKLGAGRTSRFVLRLKPLKPKRVVVRARSSARVTLPCPAGTTPAGGGFALDSAALSVRRDTSTLATAAYSLTNSGSRARKAMLYGGCLTLFRSADAPFEQLHVQATTFHVPLQPGGQTLVRTCPGGWFALDAGYALGDRATKLDGAAATTSGGRWKLTNGVDGAAPADVQLVCGRVGG